MTTSVNGTVIGNATIFHGWGKDVLPGLAEGSVDSVVCDPPYGLSKEPNMVEVLTHWLAGDDYSHNGGGFMGKSWDSFVPGPATWKEVFRVLKPGGYALVFAGSRTVDLMGISLRLAGFEIRDQMQWVYGSGFPKSLNISKAIDKAAGADREVVGKTSGHMPHAAKGWGNPGADSFRDSRLGITGIDVTAPATEEARQWGGWGTALKPAVEPIIVARKPLGEATVAANVLRHGTGGLNIDGCRIHAVDALGGSYKTKRFAPGASVNAYGKWKQEAGFGGHTKAGRFPSNLIHDGSDEVLAHFPEAPGAQGAITGSEPTQNGFSGKVYGTYSGGRPVSVPRGDSGSAARFFYCAKASAEDRGEGNDHATVKPQSLMRYLCRLVTPPGGTVLDSFAGSGSTGKAAIEEGFAVILVEQDAHNVGIIKNRILAATTQGKLF